MHTRVKLLLLVVFAGLTFSSCVSKKKFTELMSEKDGLANDLSQAKTDITNLEKEQEELQKTYENDKARMSGQIEKFKADFKSMDAKFEETNNELKAKTEAYTKVSSAVNNVFSAFEGSGLQLTARGDDVVVSSHGPIHFSSGSTRIKREHFDTIESLATILQNNPNLEIMVVGHADNQSMKSDAAIGDNRALSHARALNVVRRLIRKGASPAQLSAVGRSDYDPAVSYDGDVKEARKQNRRVEFIIAPGLANLYATPRG